jgi:transcriptional regulator with XRE-family HTH domain
MVKRPTPELDRLFRRVRKASKARGARARLAIYIGVSPTTLSDWLSGRFEPGGEVTLSMLKWVEAEEAKQQKEEASGASTPKARTTRNANTTNESKSDQPKGSHKQGQRARQARNH